VLVKDLAGGKLKTIGGTAIKPDAKTENSALQQENRR